MKKLFIYFLIFMGFFAVVEAGTYFSMKERFDFEPVPIVKFKSPAIKIEENKASNEHGYIKGTITNDTGEHLRNKYVQFDFYDKDGVYVGTKSKEIKIFNVNEKSNFDIDYKYKEVDRVEISFVDEVKKIENNNNSIFGKLFSFEADEADGTDEIDGKIKKTAMTAGLLMGIFAILP